MGIAQGATAGGLRCGAGLCALRLSLLAGTGIDWAVGAWALTSPQSLIAFFDFPNDPSNFYLRLVGVLLLVMGLVYLVAAVNPPRYLANVGLAIFGRSCGAAFYFFFDWRYDSPPVLFWLGTLNLGMALLHSVCLGRNGWRQLPAALGCCTLG